MGNYLEAKCIELAVEVVRQHGGQISFEDYDEAMYLKSYIAPFSWIAGWGNHITLKKNQDKMCAFAAVKAGQLKQIERGYQVTK